MQESYNKHPEYNTYRNGNHVEAPMLKNKINGFGVYGGAVSKGPTLRKLPNNRV